MHEARPFYAGRIKLRELSAQTRTICRIMFFSNQWGAGAGIEVSVE